MIQHGVNTVIEDLLKDSSWMCGGQPKPKKHDPLTVGEVTFLVIVTLVILGAAIAIPYTCCWRGKKGNGPVIPSSADRDRLLPVSEENNRTSKTFSRMLRAEIAPPGSGCPCGGNNLRLSQNKQVSLCMRIFVDVLLVGSCGLFVFANISAG